MLINLKTYVCLTFFYRDSNDEQTESEADAEDDNEQFDQDDDFDELSSEDGEQLDENDDLSISPIEDDEDSTNTSSSLHRLRILLV